MYGYLTTTGVRLVIVVDMEGRAASESEGKYSALLGIRDADLKPAFRAIHTAYIRLLRNPFYDPDDHTPRAVGGGRQMQIGSPVFIREMQRIGASWDPRSASL